MPVILAEDNEFFRARVRRQFGRKDASFGLPHHTYRCNDLDLSEATRAFLTYLVSTEGKPFASVDTVNGAIVGRNTVPFRTTNILSAYNMAQELPDAYEFRVLRTTVDAAWLKGEESRFIPLSNCNGAFNIMALYTEENFLDVLQYVRTRT